MEVPAVKPNSHEHEGKLDHVSYFSMLSDTATFGSGMGSTGSVDEAADLRIRTLEKENFNLNQVLEG